MKANVPWASGSEYIIGLALVLLVPRAMATGSYEAVSLKVTRKRKIWGPALSC